MKITSFVYAMLVAGTSASTSFNAADMEVLKKTEGQLNGKSASTVHSLMEADTMFERSRAQF